MQKAKFQIKGMNCKSCAFLIEEKLKKIEGVIEAKINFDSQKAVIVYDENKISEDEIKKVIKEAGDYQVKDNSGVVKEDFLKQKNLPSNNLSIPISIIIGSLIIAGSIIITNRNQKTTLNETNKQITQNLSGTNSRTLPFHLTNLGKNQW